MTGGVGRECDAREGLLALMVGGEQLKDGKGKMYFDGNLGERLVMGREFVLVLILHKI
jgi:hypothetical protein